MFWSITRKDILLISHTKVMTINATKQNRIKTLKMSKNSFIREQQSAKEGRWYEEPEQQDFKLDVHLLG